MLKNKIKKKNEENVTFEFYFIDWIKCIKGIGSVLNIKNMHAVPAHFWLQE